MNLTVDDLRRLVQQNASNKLGAFYQKKLDDALAATPAKVTITAPRINRVRFDRVRLHQTYLAVWRSVYEMASRKKDRRVVTTLADIGARARLWNNGRAVATDTVRCALAYLHKVGAIVVESWPKPVRGRWGRIKQTRARIQAPVLDRDTLAEIQKRIDSDPVKWANPAEAQRFQDRRKALTVSGAHTPGLVKPKPPEVPGIAGETAC